MPLLKYIKSFFVCEHNLVTDYEVYGIDPRTTPLPDSFFAIKKCTKCGKEVWKF